MNKEGALETYEHDKYSKINETWNINMTIYCVRMIKHKTKEKQQIAANSLKEPLAMCSGKRLWHFRRLR